MSEAGGSEDRRDEQRGFVADSASGVLVDPWHLEAREVESLAALEHGLHQRGHLAPIETAEVDRHEESGQLIVGHTPLGVREDELPDLRGLQTPSIAFAFNQAWYDHLSPAGVNLKINFPS